MVSLAVNTSTSVESVVLFSKKKIIASANWKGNRDESQKLLAAAGKLLRKNALKFKDIGRIIVTNGPGPFSAVRIGVTVANTLSFALKIPVYSIDTKTILKLRYPHKNAILLIHAGGNFVFREGFGLKGGIFEIQKALDLPSKKSHVFYGDITEVEMHEFNKIKKTMWKFIGEKGMLTFGEAIINVNFTKLKKEKVVSPKYWRPPNITHSTKNYKLSR